MLPDDSRGRFGCGKWAQAPAILPYAVAIPLLLAAGSLDCGGQPGKPVAAPSASDPSLAVHELLVTLGLDGRVEDIPARLPGASLVREDEPVRGFARRNGIFVQGISLPPRAGSGPPRSGVDLLRSELADVDRFDLVYSEDGALQAIVPFGPGLNGRAEAWFMDLTPYGIDLDRLAAATAEEWSRLSRTILQRRAVVADYIQFRGLSQRLRPVDALSKKPYVLVSLDRKTGEVTLDEFGPTDLGNADRRASLRATLANEGRFSLVYPVFPTVYSPAVSNNQAQARNFGHHVYETLRRLEPADGERILDVGTGSGYLSWVAWSTARTLGRNPAMYAIDINPLAVANARTMARLAGFPMTALAHDNVADAGGLAFPGVTFRLVIWDMPALPRLLRPHLSERGSESHPRQLMEYWDDGTTALGSLETFATSLPRLLEPVQGGPPGTSAAPSSAVLWNTAPADFPEAIPQTFRNAGLSPQLLDTYTSGSGAVTCVVYAVSLPEKRPPRP